MALVALCDCCGNPIKGNLHTVVFKSSEPFVDSTLEAVESMNRNIAFNNTLYCTACINKARKLLNLKEYSI